MQLGLHILLFGLHEIGWTAPLEYALRSVVTSDKKGTKSLSRSVCSLKCCKYSQYRWKTKRYNGDDNARSCTHTDQCTRKYESNLKNNSESQRLAATVGRISTIKESKTKIQQSFTPKQVNT